MKNQQYQMGVRMRGWLRGGWYCWGPTQFPAVAPSLRCACFLCVSLLDTAIDMQVIIEVNNRRAEAGVQLLKCSNRAVGTAENFSNIMADLCGPVPHCHDLIIPTFNACISTDAWAKTT